MTPAQLQTIGVDIEQGNIIFRATGTRVLFPGYQKVYSDGSKNNKENKLPELLEGDELTLDSFTPNQHFTQPPARYSEATLIKTLEEIGVGRPSTYSPTIDTLQRRYYVKLAARRFEPTELGEIVNNLMESYFANIVDTNFTAEMEKELDMVEAGKAEWVKVVDQFYKPFHNEVEKAEEQIQKITIKDEPANFKCPECGHEMVIKLGRYGKFYACSNFPECRHTEPIVKEIGVTCPKCHQGQVVERKSKKNRLFYGCSRYPDCDFTSWDKPINRNCPKCDHFLVEKKTRGGKQVICPNGDYEEEKQQ